MTMTVLPTRVRPARMMRRIDPFREMEDFYDRMSRLMQDVLPEAMMPAALADIEETDDSFIVDIDMPGVKPEDVNLELRDSELRITGEIKDRERKGTLRRKARAVGEFEHEVMLPGEVNRDKVEAKLHDGVLTVTIGKAEASQPRRIEVKS